MFKRLILIAVVAVVMVGMASMAEARGNFSCDGPFGGILNKCAVEEEVNIRSVSGVKLDAPNLVRFSRNWTLGVEAGKDLYTNAFQDSGAWIEDDKGYFGYLKVTYTGSLINFAKK